MEQHKIDKEFGQKLRDREIAPHPESWEKLNSMLEREHKRPGSYKWVLGIAASLIAGFLILGLVFKNGTGVDLYSPQIVDAPATPAEKEPEKQVPVKDEIIAVEAEAGEDNKAARKPAEAIPPKPKEGQIAEIHKQVGHPAGTELAVQIDLPEEIQENELPAGLEEMLAEVAAQSLNDPDMQDAEVDALLYKAAAEIIASRKNEQVTTAIDANSLLFEVEMELEQSFRDKVFDFLKEGYFKARTAVANRK